VIVAMSLVRVIGRKADLAGTIAALQDAGTLHLIEPALGDHVTGHVPDDAERRRRRDLERALRDIEGALGAFDELGATVRPAERGPIELARAALRAGHARIRAERLVARRRALAAERDLLSAYAPLFGELAELITGTQGRRRYSAYLLRLERADPSIVQQLRAGLDRLLDRTYDLATRTLPGGEVALLLLVAADRVGEVDRLLAGARVESAPVPSALAGTSLLDALPGLRPRLAEVEAELRAVATEAATLAAATGRELGGARAALHDALLALDARARAAETSRAFVLEGWTPTSALPRLTEQLRARLGEGVAIEVVARDAWHGSEAPVVLANPPFLAPFERRCRSRSSWPSRSRCRWFRCWRGACGSPRASSAASPAATRPGAASSSTVTRTRCSPRSVWPAIGSLPRPACSRCRSATASAARSAAASACTASGRRSASRRPSRARSRSGWPRAPAW